MLLLLGACHSSSAFKIDDTAGANADTASGLVEGAYDGPTVVINEAMAEHEVNPSSPEEGGDWLELYNPGGTEVILDGYFLDEARLGMGVAWPFPVGTRVPAHGYLLVGCSAWEGMADEVANFKLLADADEVALYVINDDGTAGVASRVRWELPVHLPNSWARLPNGGDEWRLSPNPTPRDANQ